MRDAKRIKKTCLNCGAEFEIPRCREWREKCCSSLCKAEYRKKRSDDARNNRKRNCRECGKEFFPRQWQIDNGIGVYCSIKCSNRNLLVAAHSSEAKEKRAESVRKAVAEGRLKPMRGQDNPRWNGGKQAAYLRNKDKQAAYTKKWRKENPERAREQTKRRRGKIIGRLPRGTISEILVLQRARCAICGSSIRDGYHVDHIYPIAKGGKHERSNIQLTCGSCNVRKNAKDPILHMQELGRLL